MFPARKPALGVLTRYADPMQQTALPFGARSHWLQPWRAYCETVPASRLRDAIGINLNVTPDEAEAVCAHLERAGFRHARLEFGWGSVSWDDPTRLSNPEPVTRMLAACQRHHLRPLLLLNAHHGVPCPVRFFDVRLTRPAAKGSRILHLEPGSLREAAAKRSGLNSLDDYWAAEYLFTRIENDGTVTLSKPLTKDLPAGPAHAATLKYLPFTPVKKGEPLSPDARETLRGWLDYVRAITTTATRALHTKNAPDSGFDLEVWNELTFGSNFLSLNNYYDKPVVEGEPAYYILDETVKFVHDPQKGLHNVGVGNGFNNQWPWGSGSNAPPGLAAQDKHPYGGVRVFPRAQGEPNGGRPVNALGQPAGSEIAPGRWKDDFIPSYVSHFPEYFLCATQTEHLIRDVSPLTTDIYGDKHGRFTHPTSPDGKPAPAPVVWITETNLDPNGANPGDYQAYAHGNAKPVAPGLTPDDAARLRAKAILRYLCIYPNKGFARLYFYGAKDENPLGLGLISPAFFARLKTRPQANAEPEANVLPAGAEQDALASPVLRAVRALVGKMAGDVAPSRVQPLTLVRIEEPQPRIQFAGDPKTANQTPNPYPPLYNRDVLAFLPFQNGPNRWTVPCYVMTRNLAQLYKPAAPASDVTRFDMPAETFRLTLRGLNGQRAVVSLFDPLTGQTLACKRLAATPQTLTLECPLTDSPRLLLLQTAPER